MRNWKPISKAESIKGHALKLVTLIRTKIRQYESSSKTRKLSGRRTETTARSIILVVSEITDELQSAARTSATPLPSWNEVYVGILKRMWHEFPHDIRNEIIRQTKEEPRA